MGHFYVAVQTGREETHSEHRVGGEEHAQEHSEM